MQLYLPLTQTLEPVAYSTGAYSGSLEIYEAQRMPFNLPWDLEFLSYYTATADLGNGWWYDRTIGWIYGDNFPWIYSFRYGWIYTGHEAGSNDLQLFFESNDWGWMLTSESLFPWFNRPSDGKWLWYLDGTYNPVNFYDPQSTGWLDY